MTLLRDELIKATGLTERGIKKNLVKATPEDDMRRLKADRSVGENAVKKNSWGYITMLYAPSDATLKDRMLKVFKIKG